MAPLLASHFRRGVHIEADTLHRMIVRGGRWPNEKPLPEGARHAIGFRESRRSIKTPD